MNREQIEQALSTADGSRFTASIVHPAFNDSRVHLVTIPRPQPDTDDSATAQTVAHMIGLARRDSSAPAVLRATTNATTGTADAEAAAAAIHAWVRRHVRFVQDATLAGFSADPDEAEVLIPPVDLLSMPAPRGDCDDFAMVTAAMLTAAEIPAAYVTVAAEDDSPDYSHVYVRAYLPPAGRPVAMDTSQPQPFGWECTPKGKLKVWPLDPTMQRQQQQRPQLRGLGFDWNGFEGVLNTGIKSATSILAPRYAVPQLAPGQYIQNGNSIMYQQPAGGAAAFGLPIAGAGGNTMLYLIGAAAVLLVVMMSGRK